MEVFSHSLSHHTICNARRTFFPIFLWCGWLAQPPWRVLCSAEQPCNFFPPPERPLLCVCMCTDWCFFRSASSRRFAPFTFGRVSRRRREDARRNSHRTKHIGGQAEKWSRRAAACAAEPNAFDQPTTTTVTPSI